jgi:protein phosphatase
MNAPLPLEFASALDMGRARSNNEDAVALDPEARLAVLADGMGGYNAGEVASEMATRLISQGLGRWLRNLASPPAETVLHEAIDDWGRQANQAIFQSAQTVPEHQGMGSTLVVAAYTGDILVVGHIGDSRAYRLREGQLERLTRDHSLLQEQLDAGMITAEQAATSTNRNLVTRALGVLEDVDVETHSHEVRTGDILMMCSDGVSDMVDEPTIARLLREADTLDAACQAIVEAANDAGGKDNISVVLVRAGGKPAGRLRGWWPFKR